MKLQNLRAFVRAALPAAIACVAACSEPDTATDDAPAAAPPPVDSALASTQQEDRNRPAEIYFDLTAFDWYREGRPLVHNGRAYRPLAEPIPVTNELREAGRYEGVSYYVMEGADNEPVYTLYVPVYYRYWQRFTSPPGS